MKPYTIPLILINKDMIKANPIILLIVLSIPAFIFVYKKIEKIK